MRILFMGTPDFAVASLRRLVADGHEVCGVFTQPDKPKNRGHKLVPTPVKEFALTQNIPVYQPLKMRDGTALELVQSLAPELTVVAAYGRILPEEHSGGAQIRLHQRPLVSAAQVPGGGPHQLGHPERGGRRPASPSCIWRRSWTQGTSSCRRRPPSARTRTPRP